jgi:hypothetical protein
MFLVLSVLGLALAACSGGEKTSAVAPAPSAVPPENAAAGH